MSDLRALFHQLRDEELPVARFQLPVAGNRQGATGNWWRAAVTAAAIVIVTIVALHHHRRPPVTESIVTWKAPTDFLLRTPGSELLSSIPRIPERR
jgi:hypothetical protein